MRFFYLCLLFLCPLVSLLAQEVILTGLLDPNTEGQAPRTIELYVAGTVDLSDYVLDRYSNTNPNSTANGNLSGTYTDEFVYLVGRSDSSAFTTAFGNGGDFANRIIINFLSGNGNDAFVLSRDGTTVDQTGGEIGDATNLYRDSYLYRADGTGPDGGWVTDNWNNVGENDALDNVALEQLAENVPFGTYQPADAGPSISVAADGDLAEPSTGGGFTFALSEPAATDLTVTYSLSGTATPGADYVAPTGSIIIPAGDVTAGLLLTVLDDEESELAETITVDLTATSDANYSLGQPATINVLDDEPVVPTAISTVQSSSMASPFTGQTLAVEGIVVGDFQGPSGEGLGGFFIQEEDEDTDGDATTSEGIWIFQGDTGVVVSAGDLVTVTGVVEENRGLTQINVTGSTAAVEVVSRGNPLPVATDLDLPVTDEADYEAYEGMLVALIDEAVVTSTATLGRFGEVEISAGERLIQFTECNEPDPVALGAYDDAQDLRRLVIDDGRGGNNNFPVLLPNGDTLSPTNTVRSGSRFTDLRGILDERFTGYRLQTTSVGAVSSDERPTLAPDLGGNLTVVGMNLLNYFTTLGERGADNADEFDRQEAKIVAAICALDADVLGLVEIENNGTGPGSATQALIDAVAAGCGKRYTAVSGVDFGNDQIKVQLIYDASVVEESGTAASLNEPIDVFNANRPPVAQTFRIVDVANDGVGGQVTVVVNHWKSKGGSCGAGDDDDGGAASCNGTRLMAATAIKAWLADDPTASGVEEQLIIGDLNAYSQEPPIIALTEDGFVNLVRAFSPAGSFPCGSTPSYVFGGQWGSLDHAIASEALRRFVTGATPWNVNAAEPNALDYDTDFIDPSLYAPDFYRFSDHDPVVIGLQLQRLLPVTLTEFVGRERDGRVVLSWTTADEYDVARFEVERRTSGGTFTTVGRVRPTGGRQVTAGYSFTDALPLPGDNVYRLRIVDTDGSFELSRLVTVGVDRPKSISLVPMGDRTFRLRHAPRGTTYRVADAAGRIVRTGALANESGSIDGSQLPAGLYFLGVQVGDRTPVTFKVILP